MYWNTKTSGDWRFVERYLENVPEIPQSGMPSAHEVHHHYLGTNNDREVVDTQSIGLADDRGVSRVEDTQSIELAYDRYLQSLVNAEADTACNNNKGIGLDIFRPFAGYKEVRLVRRDSKHHARDPLILGFVDFANPACAATALSALQGYKMDEHDINSAYLSLQFSKFPGRRFGGSGSRGKR
uniref:RNA-binding protein n=1 Tax=Solanum tuberosum TaxID=4113 RepID=M1C3T5_SOLTU